MNDRKSLLKADPTDWLTEQDNASVRWFTLTDILDIPANSPQAGDAKCEIMETGVVLKILANKYLLHIRAIDKP